MAMNEKRLYVGNLHAKTQIDDIEKFFENRGKVLDIDFKTNSRYAFVQFANKCDAENAIKRLNGRTLCGSRVSVQVVKHAKHKGGPSGRREMHRPRSPSPKHRREAEEDSLFVQYNESPRSLLDYDEHARSQLDIDLNQSYDALNPRLNSFQPMTVPIMIPVPMEAYGTHLGRQVYYHDTEEIQRRAYAEEQCRAFADADQRRAFADANANYGYEVADEIIERDYEEQRSRSRSPYMHSQEPSSQVRRNKQRDDRISSSSIDVNRQRNRRSERRSEEPEIYDVSKEAKESGTLNRCLSYTRVLAERLDKMSEKQQAFARMKIEEVMYEAEFGPNPTNTSSQSTAPFTGTLYPVGFVPNQ